MSGHDDKMKPEVYAPTVLMGWRIALRGCLRHWASMNVAEQKNFAAIIALGFTCGLVILIFGPHLVAHTISSEIPVPLTTRYPNIGDTAPLTTVSKLDIATYFWNAASVPDQVMVAKLSQLYPQSSPLSITRTLLFAQFLDGKKFSLAEAFKVANLAGCDQVEEGVVKLSAANDPPVICAPKGAEKKWVCMLKPAPSYKTFLEFSLGGAASLCYNYYDVHKFTPQRVCLADYRGVAQDIYALIKPIPHRT